MVNNKVAVVQPVPSGLDLTKFFDFPFDLYYLCSDPTVKKVLKRNVDISINVTEYDYIILIGADVTKYFLKNATVTSHTGKLVEERYIPAVSPAALSFKPEMQKAWDKTLDSINKYVSGEIQPVEKKAQIYGITDSSLLHKFLKEAIASPNTFFSIDSETSALASREGHVLGVSISYKKDHGAYIDADCIDEKAEELFKELFAKKKAILHNAKFDLAWFRYHFNWEITNYEDTMLLHYCIDENPGTHSLKQLALDYTDYGDYEAELEEFKAEYCKINGILKGDFSYAYIPFEVMYKYAAIDAIVTFLSYLRLKPAVDNNKGLKNVYNKILLPASSFLLDVQENGVPFCTDRLNFANTKLDIAIREAEVVLLEDPKIKEFSIAQGSQFNPNSVNQLRNLLFTYLKLPPITGKKTDKGEWSTDAEVLQELAKIHPVPALILTVRKLSKLRNTYITKILLGIDFDGRIRTGFNIHGTTSGRLSSSGKLNMQQLPRDASLVKGSLKARAGYVIVSVDLTTAEVYVAAVLSGDKSLMEVFRSGKDFHSSIAKKVFGLECAVEDVGILHPLLRQAAKAITFGILFGAGPEKIAEQVNQAAAKMGLGSNFSYEDAVDAIRQYFDEFSDLKKWIDGNLREIRSNGYIHSFFGRKRRLANVFSNNRGVSGHAARSGFNFLIQSVASDVTLLSGIDLHASVKLAKLDAKIFALVHDAILAEVKIEDVEAYKVLVKQAIEKDRGLTIPGKPIGFEIDVGEDYSFGKFEKEYGHEFISNRA